MNPFDYVNSINNNKKDIMVDDVAEKQYNSYMVNRSLSYFYDTVLLANEMNRYHHLDSRLQYDFLLNTIRKKNRFSKWVKPEESEAIETIKLYYGFSTDKAKVALSLLNTNQIDELKAKVYKGGRK